MESHQIPKQAYRMVFGVYQEISSSSQAFPEMKQKGTESLDTEIETHIQVQNIVKN